MITGKHGYFLFCTLFVLITCLVLQNLQAFAEENTAAATQQLDEKNAYRIDVGDALEINVWKEPELTRGVVVRLDGRITLPLIGDVMAAGQTTMGLAKILEEKIGEIIEAPTVTVILTASNSRVYYMVGEIGSGQYHLDTPLTMMQAIARAGGLGEWADQRNIMIIRRTSGKDEMIFFDYKDFIKGKDLSKNIMIEYGDTIVVFD
jgi:polysaccharide export outer membrane protein